VGFELFDNTKLGMTEFAQNVNYQRALQGELSRTINGLVEVESSRVHIVMSRKSLFLDDEQPATASVILNLARGKWLNKSQVQGIVHLISSSVPRLEPQNVTIVDNNGKLLAGLEDENAPGSITSDQLEFQEKKEHSLENRIKSMLESVLGQDKAIVRVSCDLDFVQQEKTEEMFFPENQVVRSEQTFNERSDKAAANPSGIPGLAANIVKDKTATGKTKAAGSIYQKQDNTRNYEIGKMTSRQIMPVGKLKRLSVAVVVDGTYKRVLNEEGPEAVEEIQYVPRSEAEMAKLENIVKRAVNYDETRGDKVEVVNISFAGQKPGTEAPPSRGLFERLADNAGALKYIASAFLLMLSFLFVIRPLVRWLTASPLEDYQLIEQLPKTISELEKQYSRSEDGLPFTGRAAQLIRQDQENTTRLMQDWLKES
jgi:flagellar M-ring protein FliF